MATTPTIYQDDDIHRISMRMDRGTELGLFRSVKACVIGAQCSETHIVTICVHPGYEHQPRPIDLHVEQYMTPGFCARIRRIDRMGVCIRKYPRGAPRQQNFHWTIFRQDQIKRITPPLPRNILFETFKCENAQRSVWGNLVVVKSDKYGHVCDIKERDLFFIETQVYSFFEDHSSDLSYPIIKYAGSDDGWGSSGWGGP